MPRLTLQNGVSSFSILNGSFYLTEHFKRRGQDFWYTLSIFVFLFVLICGFLKLKKNISRLFLIIIVVVSAVKFMYHFMRNGCQKFQELTDIYFDDTYYRCNGVHQFIIILLMKEKVM